MNKLIIVLIVAMIIAVVGFVLGGVVNATAQKSELENSINHTNSAQSETKDYFAWLETNDTKTGSDIPVTSINSKDFWEIFEQLVKHSMNGSS